MAYDVKDAVCLFKLKDWNRFVDGYKEKENDYYWSVATNFEKELIEERLKILAYIDKVIKEEFLC